MKKNLKFLEIVLNNPSTIYWQYCWDNFNAIKKRGRHTALKVGLVKESFRPIQLAILVLVKKQNETLIVGLIIVLEMKVENINIIRNFMLMVLQRNKGFQTKDPELNYT